MNKEQVFNALAEYKRLILLAEEVRLSIQLPDSESYSFCLHLHYNIPHISAYLKKTGGTGYALFSRKENLITLEDSGIYSTYHLQEMKAILEEWLAN